ncbi:hypothetical protein BX600DRAFT_436223 [Xylariales sp. PMI_506]|nr:hypothetical protein BX600DRAFT_436223 [Xylariales sp. PMI_506]
MDQPRTFHPFARLPSELRIAIWEVALSGAYVTVVARAREQPRESREVTLTPAGWDVGSIGEACREARSLVEGRFYRLELPPHVRCRWPCRAIHWLDFSTAVLYFESGHGIFDRISTLAEMYGTQLRYVAVSFTSWYEVVSSFSHFAAHYDALQAIFIYASEQPFELDPRAIEAHGFTKEPLPNAMLAELRGLSTMMPSRNQISDELSEIFANYLAKPQIYVLPL